MQLQSRARHQRDTQPMEDQRISFRRARLSNKENPSRNGIFDTNTFSGLSLSTMVNEIWEVLAHPT